MMRLLVLYLIPVLLDALLPPAGVNIKPAKQLDGIEEGFSSPPNLSVRSRMMAAMNSETGKSERLSSLTQPLILKRKKLKTSRSKETTREVPTVNVIPVTARPVSLSTVKLPPSADYGVTSLLKTNFVDRKGKIHRDVISVPIRVGEKKTVSSSSSLVEGESSKGVQVRFGPAPLRAKTV